MKITDLQSLIRHDFDLTHCVCIIVGHFYWILGGDSVISDQNSFKNQEKTSMFSLKKESWIEGPDLPKIVITSMVENMLGYVCITALNRTSAIFIGVGQSMQKVLLYDFAKDSWFQLEDTPKKIQWGTSSSAHEKDNKQ